METEVFTQLTAVIQDIGMFSVFLYLFIKERADHQKTRDKHIEDLREVAGMKAQLPHSNPQ